MKKGSSCDSSSSLNPDIQGVWQKIATECSVHTAPVAGLLRLETIDVAGRFEGPRQHYCVWHNHKWAYEPFGDYPELRGIGVTVEEDIIAASAFLCLRHVIARRCRTSFFHHLRHFRVMLSFNTNWCSGLFIWICYSKSRDFLKSRNGRL